MGALRGHSEELADLAPGELQAEATDRVEAEPAELGLEGARRLQELGDLHEQAAGISEGVDEVEDIGEELLDERDRIVFGGG